MTELDTLTTQNNKLIKSTPLEETALKIAKMKAESLKCSDVSRIRYAMFDALVYVVKYLRHNKDISDKQINNLSSQDLNYVPEMIFAERGQRILLLGWIPIFGWIYAGKYLAFKKRVKFLRSLGGDIFDKKYIEEAIVWSYPSSDY